MKNPWAYVVLRLVAFAAPLAGLLLLGFNGLFSTIVATAVGATISILWLSRSREELSKTLYEKYKGESKSAKAEDVEDAD
ncbi:MAG: hypothetical protein ORN27_09400 [Rhodoluna sp.]|nr:hypothetical protein [Rhodoluna sp.]